MCKIGLGHCPNPLSRSLREVCVHPTARLIVARVRAEPAVPMLCKPASTVNQSQGIKDQIDKGLAEPCESDAQSTQNSINCGEVCPTSPLPIPSPVTW